MNRFNYMQEIFCHEKPPGSKETKNFAQIEAKALDSLDEDDLYGILGCHPSATIDQLTAEYRVRAREIHPDKTCCTSSDCNPNNKTAAERQFCKLQRAKEILCNETRRRDYDRWRCSGLAVSYRKWCQLNETGGLHNSIHWFGSAGGNRKPALMAAEAEDQMTLTCRPSEEEGREADCCSLFRRTATTTEDNACNSMLAKFRNYEI